MKKKNSLFELSGQKMADRKLKLTLTKKTCIK